MASQISYEVTSLVSDEEWTSGWHALKTLRPKLLLEDFLLRKDSLIKDGYCLIGLWAEGKVVCVASYTLSPHPVYVSEMIIHDMSTLEGEQGKGHGSKILEYLDKHAVALKCGRTFVATTKAADFYTKNGYYAHATALRKIHI